MTIGKRCVGCWAPATAQEAEHEKVQRKQRKQMDETQINNVEADTDNVQ